MTIVNITRPDPPGSSPSAATATGAPAASSSTASRVSSTSGTKPFQHPIEDVDAEYELQPEPDVGIGEVIDTLNFQKIMFRDHADAFVTEQHSRAVAGYAIETGFDKEMPGEWLAFLYLPFMHSESLADQDRSVALYESAGLQENLKWAKHHRELIRRFGRFPHRNQILGRRSTKDELDYLKSDQAFSG